MARLGSAEAHSRPVSTFGCLVQFAWIFVGNAVLLAVAIRIAHESRWTFTAKDAVYGVAAAAVLCLRHVGGSRSDETAEAPAISEPQRVGVSVVYAAAMVVAWVVAHSVDL